jgi:methyl-accepting chemotaxis protein
MTINRLFQVVYAAHYMLLAILAVVGVLLFNNQADLAQSQKNRFESYLLAQQLRESSEVLTRMVRSYVSTGNPIFEQYYWHVLAIRSGHKPRPEHYHRLDWDVVPLVLAAPEAADSIQFLAYWLYWRA